MHYRAFVIVSSLALVAPVNAVEPTFATFDYASSVDGTKPLNADVCFNADAKPKPLILVMHGYSGSRKDVSFDLRELAPQGVFAVAPDMRGRGGSAGNWDSGGLDVHDILDAVLEVIKRYPKEIDAKNLNVIGYSGGGGNAIACAVRFPDLFRNCVSFFGISDYGGWYRSKGRPDCNAIMDKALGGTPDSLPDVFLARNAIPAAANAKVAKLHFVWDELEKDCPANMIDEFIKVYRDAKLDRIAVHVSKKTDPVRWIHNYRSGNRDLSKADALFMPDVFDRNGVSPRLPKSGKLIVPGYLVTRSFQVFVEDGTRGQVTIEYDLTGEKPAVKVVENAKNWRVRIETKSPLSVLP